MKLKVPDQKIPTPPVEASLILSPDLLSQKQVSWKKEGYNKEDIKELTDMLKRLSEISDRLKVLAEMSDDSLRSNPELVTESQELKTEKDGIMVKRAKLKQELDERLHPEKTSAQSTETYDQMIAREKQLLDGVFEKCIRTNPETKKETVVNTDLSKLELTALYEINFSHAEVYGKKLNDGKEELFKKIKAGRDLSADMHTIFECQASQIVHNKAELEKAIKDKKEIKAYVGELFPDIFEILPLNIEHIYTEFPEGKVKQKTIELGTGLKTEDDFVKAIEHQDSLVDGSAEDIMRKPGFVVSDKKSKENLIILSIKSLGFPNGATVEDIFERAKKLGLELCPSETGPQLRLQYTEQPCGEWCIIGMKSIAGSARLFGVHRSSDRPGLGTYGPDGSDSSGNLFAFVRASIS